MTQVFQGIERLKDGLLCVMVLVDEGIAHR